MTSLYFYCNAQKCRYVTIFSPTSYTVRRIWLLCLIWMRTRIHVGLTHRNDTCFTLQSHYFWLAHTHTHKYASTHTCCNLRVRTIRPRRGNCSFIIKTTNKWPFTWHTILERLKQNKQSGDRATFRERERELVSEQIKGERDCSTVMHKWSHTNTQFLPQPLWSLRQNNELLVRAEKKHYAQRNWRRRQANRRAEAVQPILHSLIFSAAVFWSGFCQYVTSMIIRLKSHCVTLHSSGWHMVALDAFCEGGTNQQPISNHHWHIFCSNVELINF